jgi:hypothetical protein
VWSHITVRSNLDKHYVATEATLYQTRDKCNPEFLLVKLRHYGGDIKYLVTDRVPKPDPTTQTSCIFKSEDTILLSYGPQSGLHQYDRFIHKHGVPLRTARFASPIPIGQLAILLNIVQETSPPDDFESTERLFFRYVYPIWEVLCDVGNAVVRDDVRWKDYEAISYDQEEPLATVRAEFTAELQRIEDQRIQTEQADELLRVCSQTDQLPHLLTMFI